MLRGCRYCSYRITSVCIVSYRGEYVKCRWFFVLAVRKGMKTGAPAPSGTPPHRGVVHHNIFVLAFALKFQIQLPAQAYEPFLLPFSGPVSMIVYCLTLNCKRIMTVVNNLSITSCHIRAIFGGFGSLFRSSRCTLFSRPIIYFAE